jgi:tetratricopeptide (TPR) repeat protein
VDKTAEEKEIRDAYYYLARRYHPDRFRTGELQDLFDLIEQYFVKVTEAYNTLIDPDRRSQYDEEQASRAVREEEPEVGTGQLARQNFVRAMALLAKKRFHDAVTFLENAIQLDDSQATYHLELGQVLSRNPRRRDDAERHLRRAAELDPASPKPYFALGELLLKVGRGEEAASMFRETLRWEAGHAEAQARLKEIGSGGRPSRG